MDGEINSRTDRWFDSTFLILNESHQLDLRRILSPGTCELIQTLKDFHMYDHIGLFIHLLGLTSHYLTSTSFVYADNQLKRKLNLHLLLIVQAGYERSSLIEHIKRAMCNVQCIRQTGQHLDARQTFNSNIFCRLDDQTQQSSNFCISDNFEEHGTNTHLQRQQSSSIIGTSNGHFIRQLIDTKFNNKNLPSNNNTDWLMIFIASKARLFCHRLKVFDQNRYPSLEQWIIMINCLCSNLTDFYFDELQANQCMCDYLDTLSLKAISLENGHPWMASRYLSAREHVLRVSASLCIIEMAEETLINYRRTFHSFCHADKIFFDNSTRIIEQTRNTTRVNINLGIVQAAIYFVNNSIKQYEIMFEPTLNTETPNSELQSSPCDHPWALRSSSSFLPESISSSSLPPDTTTLSSSKRMKTFLDPSYVKSLELAHELLLLPYVAFTRTSVYINSKLKRNAVFLDSVIEELKKQQLIIIIRQGVEMVDGTRRRVDLLVKCVPVLKENEQIHDTDLIQRLSQFGVEYERYIQTLVQIDIGEKYRLSDQSFDLLNSSDYKRYFTIDLERIAPIHRIRSQEEIDESEKSSNIKSEPADFYV